MRSLVLDNNRDTVEEFWDRSTLDAFKKNNTACYEKEFISAMSQFLGTSGDMQTFPNARTALVNLLRATSLARPGRKNILLCSFNCPVVASAIIKAGLKAETFDFHTKNGKIDWIDVAAKITSRHAGLIVSHFFGVPYDFRPVLNAARRNESFVIEDCAHTLGATIDGQVAGTLGDAAIFSFNYDKPISLGGGGLLLVNNPELQPAIAKTSLNSNFETEYTELIYFLEFLNIRRKAIHRQSMVTKLFSKVKRTIGMHGYTFSFPEGIGALRSALGCWQLKKYPDIINVRNRNAEIIRKNSRIDSWNIDSQVNPAWLKQKVLCRPGSKPQKMSANLQRLGLRVGPFNWRRTVDSILGMPEKPNAKYVAKHGLDIPVHQNINTAEIEFISNFISD